MARLRAWFTTRQSMKFTRGTVYKTICGLITITTTTPHATSTLVRTNFKKSDSEKHLLESYPIGSTRDLLVRHSDHTCISIHEGRNTWLAGLAFFGMMAVVLVAFATCILTRKICTNVDAREPAPALASVPARARVQVPHARLALDDDGMAAIGIEMT